MPNFPSKLTFAAFYQYASKGQSPFSMRSKAIVSSLKDDVSYPRGPGGVRVVPRMAERVAEEFAQHSCLNDYLRKGSVLVPVPGHRPLKEKENSSWSARAFCIELCQRKSDLFQTQTLLNRITPIRKSAMSDDRPFPPEHYETLAVSDQLPALDLSHITLVDDVVTRGSTFLAAYQRMIEAFPESEIRCFAIVRTISSGEIQKMIDPREGIITYENGKLKRVP